MAKKVALKTPMKEASKESFKKLDKEVDVQEDTILEEQGKVIETKPKKKVFQQTDRIKCHSVTLGGLYLEGTKTKVPYSFSDYGDVTEIEYRDLVGLIHAKSSFIFHPYFIIDDKDFVAEFPHLEKFYTEFYEINDLAEILSLPLNQMIEKIKKLPSGAAENLKYIASTQVADGQLDSVSKIKALSEFFDIDLNLIAEFRKD